jgi:hypothetical protein
MLVLYDFTQSPLIDAILANTPPVKAGGFMSRLKAGLIGHSADDRRYTTVKSSSCSRGCWFLMYSFHT